MMSVFLFICNEGGDGKSEHFEGYVHEVCIVITHFITLCDKYVTTV